VPAGGRPREVNPFADTGTVRGPQLSPISFGPSGLLSLYGGEHRPAAGDGAAGGRGDPRGAGVVRGGGDPQVRWDRPRTLGRGIVESAFPEIEIYLWQITQVAAGVGRGGVAKYELNGALAHDTVGGESRSTAVGISVSARRMSSMAISDSGKTAVTCMCSRSRMAKTVMLPGPAG